MVDCFWSLLNKRDKSRIDGLRTVQVLPLIRAFARNDSFLAEWMVWQEGTDVWSPAETLVKSVNEAKKLHKHPPKPPAIHFENDEPITESNFTHEDENDLMDLRMYTRYLHKFPVTFLLKEGAAQTTTVNISLLGMRTAASLPEGAPRIVTAEITNGGRKVTAICRVIKESDGDRFRFESVDRVDYLKQWMLSGLELAPKK